MMMMEHNCTGYWMLVFDKVMNMEWIVDNLMMMDLVNKMHFLVLYKLAVAVVD